MTIDEALMKITIEMDRFALRLLVAVGLAVWVKFVGGSESVLGLLAALLDT